MLKLSDIPCVFQELSDGDDNSVNREYNSDSDWSEENIESENCSDASELDGDD